MASTAYHSGGGRAGYSSLSPNTRFFAALGSGMGCGGNGRPWYAPGRVPLGLDLGRWLLLTAANLCGTAANYASICDGTLDGRYSMPQSVVPVPRAPTWRGLTSWMPTRSNDPRHPARPWRGYNNKAGPD